MVLTYSRHYLGICWRDWRRTRKPSMRIADVRAEISKPGNSRARAQRVTGTLARSVTWRSGVVSFSTEQEDAIKTLLAVPDYLCQHRRYETHAVTQSPNWFCGQHGTVSPAKLLAISFYITISIDKAVVNNLRIKFMFMFYSLLAMKATDKYSSLNFSQKMALTNWIPKCGAYPPRGTRPVG